jgi:hypothetical protein
MHACNSYQHEVDGSFILLECRADVHDVSVVQDLQALFRAHHMGTYVIARERIGSILGWL